MDPSQFYLGRPDSGAAEILKHPTLGGGFTNNDRSFHKTIASSSAGPRLKMLHEAIEPQAERYWRLYAAYLLADRQNSLDEHEDIIKLEQRI